MPRVCCKAVASAGVLLLASLMVGCAAGNTAKRVLEPQYHGTWIEIGGSYWWDISANGAHLYRVSETEECERMATTIVGKNRINVIALADGGVSLRLDGDELLTTQAGDTAHLQRTGRSNICRRASGRYLRGAPFGTDAR
jgi:hypothetical protein